MGVKSICGVIRVSTSPEKLAEFYSEVLGVRFEREDHGGLATHFGADIGTVHFGIHPPENFKGTRVTTCGTVVAFDVDSLIDCRSKIERLGGKCLDEPHDEGFGMTAVFQDIEGNPFEVVELNYQFTTP
jgi:predicted enzyme related to lactoylglutathione lyase